MTTTHSNPENLNGKVQSPNELEMNPWDDMELENPGKGNAMPSATNANRPLVDISASAPKAPKSNSIFSKWSGLSLRAKTTIIAIALGTLPVIAIGGGTNILANNTVTQKIERQKEATALEIANTLNAFLFERYSDIEALASLPSFSDDKIRSAQTQAQKSALLTRYADTYGIYDSIAAFDLNGNVIAQSRGPKLPNHASRSYFQEALKTGGRVVGSPQFSKSSGVFAMYYATPLKDSKGKTFGVIRARMPMKLGLKDLLGQYSDDTRQFYLVSNSGEIVHASNDEVINKKAKEVWSDFKVLSTPGETQVGMTGNSVRNSNQLYGNTYTEEYRGMPNLDLNIVSTLPADVAFQDQRNLTLALLFGTAAAAVAVAGIASYLAKQVTNPIQSAATAVAQMGQGDLSVRVKTKGQDELAALGQNINMMASDLEELVAAQKDEAQRLEAARLEAREEADKVAAEQKEAKEILQKRALELLMEVDPVSKGDLTIRASVTPDEIGTVADSYNAIIKSLGDIVRDVKGAVVTVTETAEQNESSVQKVATDANNQVEQLSVVLEQVQELTQASEGVTDKALNAKEQVELANKAVSEGDIAMDKTVAGISSIRDTVSDTAKKVKKLGEASQKISQVVNLIGDFAAQTNLLALNAAIEAARAGEEGRGFSVVAEEVRALAQQSANATADIEKLVEEIQAQTNTVVVAMEEGTEQVVTGTQLVEESREKLSEITAVSTKLTDIIREISNSAVEQTNISSQIGQTMEDFSSAAEETSTQSNEVASSFAELLEIAKGLQGRIEQFKIS